MSRLSPAARIAVLVEKKETLNARIIELEQGGCPSDHLEIQSLKRKKLLHSDEIVRLESQCVSA